MIGRILWWGLMLSILGIVVSTILLEYRISWQELVFGQDSDNHKPVVTLIQEPWQASVANTAVAKILLEEKLGYTVQVTDITNQQEQAQALISGQASAHLVMWNSDLSTAFQRYLSADIIHNGGPVGITGRANWYVPAYMLETHPQLKHWEALKEPDIVKLFVQNETGGKGVIWSGSPAWGTHIEAIIKNLDLPYVARLTGSEETLIQKIEQAYRNREPILFYLWAPHLIHLEYDLVEVKLPPYSSECYALIEIDGINCGYPKDVWFKALHPGLKQKAPVVYQFFKNFYFSSTEQQIQLMQAVAEGPTPEQGARRWIREHEDIWRKWLPKDTVIQPEPTQ